MAADSQQRSPGGREPSVVRKRRRDVPVNALLGAVTAFVVGTLPLVGFLAPVAGGAMAGYRQNTGTWDGVKVGAVAGIGGALGVNFLAPPRFFGLLDGDVVGGFLLATILFAFVVWVVTSAFGGAIGARAAED